MEIFGILLLIFFGSLIILAIYMGLSSFFYKETATGFKQGTVEVDYTRGKIIVKFLWWRKEFDVSQVTYIGWNQEARMLCTAYIEIEDLNCPQHQIIFFEKNEAVKFLRRLQIAIKKAGGPEFH